MRFVAGLNFLTAWPASVGLPPAESVAFAMAHGVPAILPPPMKERFGPGPIYASSKAADRILRELSADPARLRTLRAETEALAARRFGPERHLERLAKLTGKPAASHKKRKAGGRGRVGRILFVASNGVGLGHLTRLLAIARRLPAALQPVFATFSQAMPIVQQAGYPVEFLPTFSYANCDPRDWNVWLTRQLEQILAFHDANAIVFDGTSPYAGVRNAAALRAGIKLVWVRRGMWLAEQGHAALQREALFDLVIEPGETAGSRDRGATVWHRALTLAVPPISLLDPEELYDRETAARRLGLDPSRPAVLIQLGSGENRDLSSLLDAIMRAFEQRQQLQPVIAEWLIAERELDLWPDARRLTGFPIAKYYNAFDFTIAAAGYNSFNEIITFGLPAIFLANEHMTVDDQAGRAFFAEREGAAYRLPERELSAIGSVIDAVLDPETRSTIRANCARLRQPNGATQAADAIAALVA
jgi:UDP:flavonoid glycosyltransferase YjiC (YdhE family)